MCQCRSVSAIRIPLKSFPFPLFSQEVRQTHLPHRHGLPVDGHLQRLRPQDPARPSQGVAPPRQRRLGDVSGRRARYQLWGPQGGSEVRQGQGTRQKAGRQWGRLFGGGVLPGQRVRRNFCNVPNVYLVSYEETGVLSRFGAFFLNYFGFSMISVHLFCQGVLADQRVIENVCLVLPFIFPLVS